MAAADTKGKLLGKTMGKFNRALGVSQVSIEPHRYPISAEEMHARACDGMLHRITIGCDQM